MLNQHPRNIDHCCVIVAHPAHELQVHGFLESHRPIVHVLTDGSGRNSKPRLGSTAKILQKTGCERGSLFGQTTDPQIYQRLLSHSYGLFLDLTSQLAQSLVQSRTRLVVGDAAEGQILTHDICRQIINSAVKIASRVAGYPIENLEFNVVGGRFVKDDRRIASLELGPESLKRKIDTANGYQEVSTEVQAFFDAYGLEIFRTEQFRAAAVTSGQHDNPPAYETHARRLVEQGVYQHAVGYDEHVAPLMHALSEFADQSTQWAAA